MMDNTTPPLAERAEADVHGDIGHYKPTDAQWLAYMVFVALINIGLLLLAVWGVAMIIKHVF